MNREKMLKQVKLILSITDEQCEALRPVIETSLQNARKEERERLSKMPIPLLLTTLNIKKDK